MDAGRHVAYAGIDTHKGTHCLALLDQFNCVVSTCEFPADRDGYEQLARAIGDTGVLVGIEGTRSYGAGVAEHLRRKGYEVREVIRPKRSQRRKGKSDPLDAISAAKNASSGEGLPVKRLDDQAGAIRALLIAREQSVSHMTSLYNCIDQLLVTAPAPIRDEYAALSTEKAVAALLDARPRDAYLGALRDLARAWRDEKGRAAAYEGRLKDLVKRANPALLGVKGVGVLTAAQLIVTAGSNPGRMKSEAAFSMLCGTSPIPASSGKTSGRHRLNRGGDRKANCAIHRIARVRMAHDDETKSYVEKKRREGKTKREAIRCLCRYIAREVFKCLANPHEACPAVGELVRRRKALKLKQSDIARAIHVPPVKISRLEREVTFENSLLKAYSSCMEQLEGGHPLQFAD